MNRKYHPNPLLTQDLCSINDGDTAWVITASVLVLGMLPGLALFEAGLLHSKHSLSIMMQVLAGILVLSVMWTLVGFSFTFGTSLYGIIGNPASNALFLNLKNGECLKFAPTIPGYVYAIFQMMFAAITPLLMTGSFAGRMRFSSFFFFIILWELLIYYPLAHWIWGGGWMSPTGIGLPQGEGVIDFAGGITIHTSAGTGALVSAIMLGPRAKFGQKEFRASNLTMALLGTTFLWLGWFGFNAGSAGSAGALAAIAVANTQLCACISGLSWLILHWIHHHRISLIETLNGTIAGLAGITPASGFISPEYTMIVALILGPVSYYGVIVLKQKLFIDDSLDVSVVHGLTGMIGSLSSGFFASKTINHNGENGLIEGRGIQIVYQFMGIIVAASWSGFWTFLILWFLDKVMGIRVSYPVEKEGLGSKHAESLDDFQYYYYKDLKKYHQRLRSEPETQDPPPTDGSLQQFN